MSASQIHYLYQEHITRMLSQGLTPLNYHTYLAIVTRKIGV